MDTRLTGRATLVAGPPCGGKNTYVRQHMAPGDLIVDYDAIMAALSGQDMHDHYRELRPYVCHVRDHLVDKWMSRKDVDLWLIGGCPKRRDREYFARRGFAVVMIDTDRRTCLRRAKEERPGEWWQFVERWFNDYEAPGPAERVEQRDTAPPLARVSRRW